MWTICHIDFRQGHRLFDIFFSRKFNKTYYNTCALQRMLFTEMFQLFLIDGTKILSLISNSELFLSNVIMNYYTKVASLWQKKSVYICKCVSFFSVVREPIYKHHFNVSDPLWDILQCTARDVDTIFLGTKTKIGFIFPWKQFRLFCTLIPKRRH